MRGGLTSHEENGAGMIHGIGVDATEIARIAKALENPRFLPRIFTPAESLSVGDGPEAVRRWAARFAAKEALIKACGGIRGSRWTDIEIVRQEHHEPLVRVKGPLGVWLQERQLHIWMSFTHERLYAIAMVVLEKREDYASQPDMER
ncbi:holo-[acyl-carrier-protein] synthase [Sulfobacillus thermotolerans]|uniref:Holo-[acyl-carrier-protein] synthase n=2 Tax=Clostridiales Family XVII. Incertae Sedis TaxID=539000 RepID=A0ABN5H475_9FIRM|nr:holo-[acyl-carrier-protein] synthase [Sulfobacillus thermotolerans]